jgi:hypothetical protein
MEWGCACTGEHRMTTDRARCFDCSEWCYPGALCVRGEYAKLEARVAEIEKRLEPVALARRFHECYELLAPEFRYSTRKESAVPWDEVPEPNRSLMVAVATAIAHEALDR